MELPPLRIIIEPGEGWFRLVDRIVAALRQAPAAAPVEAAPAGMADPVAPLPAFEAAQAERVPPDVLAEPEPVMPEPAEAEPAPVKVKRVLSEAELATRREAIKKAQAARWAKNAPPAEPVPEPAPAPLKRWTPERRALFTAEWEKGVPTRVIMDQLNAMPGEPIHMGLMSTQAANMGLTRPPGFEPVRISPKPIAAQPEERPATRAIPKDVRTRDGSLSVAALQQRDRGAGFEPITWADAEEWARRHAPHLLTGRGSTLPDVVGLNAYRRDNGLPPWRIIVGFGPQTPMPATAAGANQ